MGLGEGNDLRRTDRSYSPGTIPPKEATEPAEAGGER